MIISQHNNRDMEEEGFERYQFIYLLCDYLGTGVMFLVLLLLLKSLHNKTRTSLVRGLELRDVPKAISSRHVSTQVPDRIIKVCDNQYEDMDNPRARSFSFAGPYNKGLYPPRLCMQKKCNTYK